MLVKELYERFSKGAKLVESFLMPWFGKAT
jgi:hypothetical protein